MNVSFDHPAFAPSYHYYRRIQQDGESGPLFSWVPSSKRLDIGQTRLIGYTDPFSMTTTHHVLEGREWRLIFSQLPRGRLLTEKYPNAIVVDDNYGPMILTGARVENQHEWEKAMTLLRMFDDDFQPGPLPTDYAHYSDSKRVSGIRRGGFAARRGSGGS